MQLQRCILAKDLRWNFLQIQVTAKSRFQGVKKEYIGNKWVNLAGFCYLKGPQFCKYIVIIYI